MKSLKITQKHISIALPSSLMKDFNFPYYNLCGESQTFFLTAATSSSSSLSSTGRLSAMLSESNKKKNISNTYKGILQGPVWLVSLIHTFLGHVAGREEPLLTVRKLPHPPVVVVFVEHRYDITLEETQLIWPLGSVIIHRYHLHKKN